VGGAYQITSTSMAFLKTTAAELPETKHFHLKISLIWLFKGFFGDNPKIYLHEQAWRHA
jgi:hypothetical protein